MAGVVVGDRQLQFGSRGDRAKLGQELAEVARPSPRTPAPVRPRRGRRPAGAVLLHGRAAAGRVHHDRRRRPPARRPRSSPLANLASLRAPPAVQRQRAAAALTARHDDVAPLGREHPGRRGVDLREEHLLHAAGQHSDDGPALAPGRESWSASRQPRRRPADRAGAIAMAAAASGTSRPSSLLRAATRSRPVRLGRPERHEGGPQPGRYGNVAKMAARTARSRRDLGGRSRRRPTWSGRLPQPRTWPPR